MNIESSWILGTAHRIAGHTLVETAIIGANMWNVQMAYNIAQAIQMLTNRISMQWRHFYNWLRIQLPYELNK